MKKIYNNGYLYLLFVVIISISSCTKWLDEKPQTEYSSQNFWQGTAQAAAALNGAYTLLQPTMNTEYFYYGEGRSDIDTLGAVNDANSISVSKNTLSINLSYADWGSFYQVIKQTNLVISNVIDMKARGIYNANNIAEYKRVLGQAYGLRALCYFYLTRVWGNVPLITQPLSTSVDINSYKTPRTDTTLIFQTIANDLYTARSLLPTSYTSSGATRINLTSGAIDAILTDYYMTRNNVDSALVFSQNVINNSQYKLTALYNPNVNYFSSTFIQGAIDSTEYAKMFSIGYSNESIFELDYNYTEGTSSGFATMFGNGGASLFNGSPRLINKFDVFPGDPRTVVAFKSANQIYKFFPKGTFDRTKQNDQNIIIYRLADIMLLRAEALVRKGDRPGAWALIKSIRERSFGPVGGLYNSAILGPTSPPEQTNFYNLSTSAATNYVLDERARELCFEGKRWFDLVRTGRAIAIMGPINGMRTKDNILWPIGINVIKRNPLIEQNSYYK